ncbi:MAG: GreA/GreB family elongation factor [Patescibacteria group bacterium]
MKYFFLSADYDRLIVKRQELASNYQQIKSELAEDSSQSSETWHDNYIFEQAMRDLDLYGKRLAEIDKMIRQAEIIFPANGNDSVAIGNGVELADDQGLKMVFKIGSYNSGGWLETEGNRIAVVAYNSPLGQKLLHRQVGEELELLSSGNIKKYRIGMID